MYLCMYVLVHHNIVLQRFTPDQLILCDAFFVIGVKVPIAVLGAEFDQVSPPELLKEFQEVLIAKRPEVLRLSKLALLLDFKWCVFLPQ